MRWLVIAVAGCSFSPPQSTSKPDDAAIDAIADVAIDVPPDVTTNQAIQFVQGRAATLGDSPIVTLTYLNTEGVGNLNLVIATWANNASVMSVHDEHDNAYTPATTRLSSSSAGHVVVMEVFYRANVAASQPTVFVQFDSLANEPELRIAEYSGLATSSPVDGTPRTAEGTGTDLDTGTLNTSQPHELLVAAEVSADMVNATDSMYTSRSQLAVAGDIVEDREVTTTGTYHATARLVNSSPWAMALIAFVGASQP